MAEKKDSEKTDGKKPSNPSSLLSKTWHGLPVVVIAAVGLFVVGVVIIYVLTTPNKNKPDVSSDEQQQSVAENLEKYQLEEDATLDDVNSKNLKLAWAYFSESNYETTLEYLGEITDLEDKLLGSYNQLYGVTLLAVGRAEEALPYNQAVLDSQLQILLDQSKEDELAYYNIALLYENVNDAQRANEYYDLFIEAFDDPELPKYLQGTEEQKLVEQAKSAVERLSS